MPHLTYTAIWLIVLVIFAVLEMVTAGTMVSVWFCAGAFVAWLAALAGLSFFQQTVVFIAVSIVLLILIKPFVDKHIHKNIIMTNAQALVGKTCIVQEEINNITSSGTVKADGKLWTARSEQEHETIPVGTEVKIVEIRGVKLIVKKID